MDAQVVLLGKAGCHLCDEAAEALTQVLAEFQLPLQRTDIAEHPELAAQYQEMIPVLLVDGVQRDFLKIDPQRLRRILLNRHSREGGGQPQSTVVAP